MGRQKSLSLELDFPTPPFSLIYYLLQIQNQSLSLINTCPNELDDVHYCYHQKKHQTIGMKTNEAYYKSLSQNAALLMKKS